MSMTVEGTMIETAEAMKGIDMTTAEAMTIIVKAMPNYHTISESR
jgi:hypothetical protein